MEKEKDDLVKTEQKESIMLYIDQNVLIEDLDLLSKRRVRWKIESKQSKR